MANPRDLVALAPEVAESLEDTLPVVECLAMFPGDLPADVAAVTAESEVI